MRADSPECELAFNRVQDAIQARKVVIVEASPAGQLPDTLNGVQLRAVGREDIARKSIGVLRPPRASVY